MNSQKQCPRGHIYEGDTCPYCKTELYPTMGTKKTRTYYPNQEEIKTKTYYPTDNNCGTKPTAYPDTETANIPLCPHCGRPVRRFVPNPPAGTRVSSMKDINDGKVPWNYGWDGRCENCGHDFSIIMNIDMGSTGTDNRERQTCVRASAAGFNHHELTMSPGEMGINTVLSGVEIETKCGKHFEKIFLSANELKYLMKVLQDSPILKQLDYYTKQL